MAALVAAGWPVGTRFTWRWWCWRPLWWGGVLVLTGALVAATGALTRRRRREPTADTRAWRDRAGLALLSATGAAAGLSGPRTAALAVVSTTLAVGAWWMLSG
jgi:hypothetical protein